MGRFQLAVDHDHETGKVRGLLHHYCNHLMTVFDNKFLFERFMRYKRGGTMAATRSRIGRVCEYFRNADLDEVRVAFTLAKEIVERRLADNRTPAPVAAKRTRRPKTTAQAQHEAAAGNGAETLADA